MGNGERVIVPPGEIHLEYSLSKRKIIVHRNKQIYRSITVAIKSYIFKLKLKINK